MPAGKNVVTFAFGTFLLLGCPGRASADVITVAGVTCIPTTSGSCVDPDVSPQVRWRVVNWLSSTFNGYAEDTDLLDVGLTFRHEGGTLSWHWDVVQPGSGFVETDLFDSAFLSTFVTLTLTATLPQTTFAPVFRGDSYLMFVADSPFVSGSQTGFPPPLTVLATGTFSRPTPEPGTLVLLGTGALAVAFRARSRRVRGAKP